MSRPSLSPMLLGGMLLSLYACAEQTPDATVAQALNHATLAGQTLTLENQGQRCALRKSDQSLLVLDIPSPCAFSVDRKGLPRVEPFNDNARIIVVYHTQPGPAPSRDCETRYQAVRQYRGNLEASIVGRMASCMGGPIDQKNYVGLFTW